MRIIQRSALRLRRLLSRLSRVLRDSSYESARRKMSRRRRYIMIIYKVLTRSPLILQYVQSERVSLIFYPEPRSFMARYSRIINSLFRLSDPANTCLSMVYSQCSRPRAQFYLQRFFYYIHFGIYRNCQET